MEKFLQKNQSLGYVETSAKTAEHIEEAFHKVAAMLVAADTKKQKRKNGKEQKENK